MNITLDKLRDALGHPLLQSPTFMLRFEHTGLPSIVSEENPTDYVYFPWASLQMRSLVNIHVGFTTFNGRAGFTPVNIAPAIVDGVYALRMLRLIPDSGDISLHRSDSTSQVTSLACKMKVGILLVEDEDRVSRQVSVDTLFDFRLDLLRRRIEI